MPSNQCTGKKRIGDLILDGDLVRKAAGPPAKKGSSQDLERSRRSLANKLAPRALAAGEETHIPVCVRSTLLRGKLK
jgi:hypothetical protein